MFLVSSKAWVSLSLVIIIWLPGDAVEVVCAMSRAAEVVHVLQWRIITCFAWVFEADLLESGEVVSLSKLKGSEEVFVPLVVGHSECHHLCVRFVANKADSTVCCMEQAASVSLIGSLALGIQGKR